MNQEFKGALRKIPSEDRQYLYESRQIYESSNYPSNRYDRLDRTDRSEYSTVNRLNTASSFDKNPAPRQMYSQNIPVKIYTPQMPARQSFLRVEIQVVYDNQSSVTKINLTDDQKPTFLWCFYLKEVQYLDFKNHQKLKVDYAGFPNSVIKILNMLLENDKQGVRFVCEFQIEKSGGRASLRVLQSNQIKDNMNLQLKFKEATDEQSKIYLGQKLQRSDYFNQQLGIQNQQNKDQIRLLKSKISELTELNKNYADDKIRELSNCDIEYKKRINQIKNQQLIRQTNLKKQTEVQMRNLRQKLESEIQKLKQRNIQLEKKYEQSSSQSDNYQSKSRQFQRNFNITSKELQSIRVLYAQTKEQLKREQDYKIKQERTNVEFQCRIQSLTRQLKDKQVIIENTQQLKTNQNSHVQDLQSTVATFKKQIEKKEKAISQKQEQNVKLKKMVEVNEIKNKQMKNKIKQKNQVIKNQHSIIESLQKKDLEYKQTIFNLQKLKSKIQDQLNVLKSQSAAKSASILQMKTQLQESNNMIKHYNKQLTERTVGPSRIAPPSSIMQSTFRTSFNYDMPSTMTKSSLSPSIPLPGGDRIQPQIKKYLGSSNINIPAVKTQNTNALNQQQQPQDLREHTLRVNAVKYRSPSNSKS